MNDYTMTSGSAADRYRARIAYLEERLRRAERLLETIRNDRLFAFADFADDVDAHLDAARKEDLTDDG